MARWKVNKIIDIVNLPKDTPITEYFCNGCGQLRLSLIKDKTKCLFCGSKLVQHAPVNTLDKDKLKAEYAAKQKEPQC